MSSKQLVLQRVAQMPDTATLYEIAREIEFIAAVQEGLNSYEREGGLSVEEMRARVTAWAKAPST